VYVAALWRDFAEKFTDLTVSYELYRRVFEEENIAFGQPSQDDCEICQQTDRHSKQQLEDHNADNCMICISSKEHLERARKARREYQDQHSDITNKTYTADMQKIILLPKLTIKQHFFVSRLVVFNETFACLNEGQKDLAMLWHEAINGRTAANVAAAYVKCLEMSDSDRITIWADNCCGQNKNWTLYTTLCHCVNQEWGPREVSVKYLEKGHTYMKADSVHGSIGKKLKKQAEVLTFPDFVDLVDTAGKSIKPVVLETTDFHEFTAQNRTRKTKHLTLPLLSTICCATFRKDSRLMFFKTDFDQEEQSVDFLTPKCDVKTFPPSRGIPRGIKICKKEGILKLLNDIPSTKKKFWLDLPTNEASIDLVSNVE